VGNRHPRTSPRRDQKLTGHWGMPHK